MSNIFSYARSPMRIKCANSRQAEALSTANSISLLLLTAHTVQYFAVHRCKIYTQSAKKIAQQKCIINIPYKITKRHC